MSIGEGGMDAVREQEIARYVDQVRQALADLPPRVRDELLEDLPEHLAEVAAETDGPLADRIGPPQAYAAELRGAAGVRPPTTGRNLDQKIAAAVGALRGRLRAADTRVGPLIGYARASEYLRLLRPLWWVVRGYLAAMLLTFILDGPSFGLLPRIGGSTLAAALLVVATVLGSVWLGRRSERFGARARLVLHGGALVLAVFALYAFVELDDKTRSGYYDYQTTYHDPYSHIQDVYVYDSEGRLIEGVRLFDQNGQPIRLGYRWCPEAQPFPENPDVQRAVDARTRDTYPYCPEGAPFRLRPLVPPTAPAPAAPASPGSSPATPDSPGSPTTPDSPAPTSTTADGATPVPDATPDSPAASPTPTG